MLHWHEWQVRLACKPAGRWFDSNMGHQEVMAMRGSRIAKQIIYEQRREAKRKEILLELRKRLLKERGENNEHRGDNNEHRGDKR